LKEAVRGAERSARRQRRTDGKERHLHFAARLALTLRNDEIRASRLKK
jgi:hypothetical protein